MRLAEDSQHDMALSAHFKLVFSKLDKSTGMWVLLRLFGTSEIISQEGVNMFHKPIFSIELPFGFVLIIWPVWGRTRIFGGFTWAIGFVQVYHFTDVS